jgi:hypothetical protein
MDAETKNLLQEFLFNYAEPPFIETDEVLAKQFAENIDYLWAADGQPEGWHPDNHIVDADDVRRVIDERINWK